MSGPDDPLLVCSFSEPIKSSGIDVVNRSLLVAENILYFLVVFSANIKTFKL